MAYPQWEGTLADPKESQGLSLPATVCECECVCGSGANEWYPCLITPRPFSANLATAQLRRTQRSTEIGREGCLIGKSGTLTTSERTTTSPRSTVELILQRMETKNVWIKCEVRIPKIFAMVSKLVWVIWCWIRTATVDFIRNRLNIWGNDFSFPLNIICLSAVIIEY